MSRSLYTAKFKRDYVAYSAIVIFFLIVITEVVLAISIPVFLVDSDLWAINIKRQELIAQYDSIRKNVNEQSLQPNPDAELKIVAWSLNMMAGYLRNNIDELSSDQIKNINDDFKNLLRIAHFLTAQQYYNHNIPISTDSYVKKLGELLTPILENPGENR